MDKFAEDGIPFDLFASFERIADGNPVLACEPPEWAAAAHAIVVGGHGSLPVGQTQKGQLLGVDAQHGAGERPRCGEARPEEPCPVALAGRV